MSHSQVVIFLGTERTVVASMVCRPRKWGIILLWENKTLLVMVVMMFPYQCEYLQCYGIIPMKIVKREKNCIMYIPHDKQKKIE